MFVLCLREVASFLPIRFKAVIGSHSMCVCFSVFLSYSTRNIPKNAPFRHVLVFPKQRLTVVRSTSNWAPLCLAVPTCKRLHLVEPGLAIGVNTTRLTGSMIQFLQVN